MEQEKKIHKTKKDRHGNYFEHKNKLKAEQGVKNFSILPHPATLESYETISPGITEKLSGMIIKEQEFRHKKEMLYMRSAHGIYKIGQLLSAILSIALIYITLLIYNEHKDPYISGLISVSGFAFLTIVNIYSFKRMTDFKNHKKKQQRQ